MNLKKVLGLAAACVAGFAAGAAVGYVRALRDVDEVICPDNCECAGECSMCAGAHSVVADAQENATVAETPVAASVSENIEATAAAEGEIPADADMDVAEEILPADAIAEPHE